MITEEELIGLCVRERNGRDCDYERGTDGIVITREEWDRIVITREKQTKLRLGTKVATKPRVS